MQIQFNMPSRTFILAIAVEFTFNLMYASITKSSLTVKIQKLLTLEILILLNVTLLQVKS